MGHCKAKIVKWKLRSLGEKRKIGNSSESLLHKKCPKFFFSLVVGDSLHGRLGFSLEQYLNFLFGLPVYAVLV